MQKSSITDVKCTHLGYAPTIFAFPLNIVRLFLNFQRIKFQWHECGEKVDFKVVCVSILTPSEL